MNLNRALIAAIKKSDASKVDVLLAEGADANTRDVPEKHQSVLERVKQLFHPLPPDRSPTALLVALHAPDRLLYGFPPATLPIVTSLLRHKADVNAEDGYKNRPLTALFFQEHGSYEVYPEESAPLLETILKYHADLDAPGPNSGSLPIACESGFTNIVKILIAHGCNVNSKPGGEPPLVLAVVYNQPDIARLLLNHGANVNPEPGLMGTPLAAASKNHDARMIALLKSHGAKE